LFDGLVQPEGADHGASPKHARKRRLIRPKKMKCLRQRRLARVPWRWKLACLRSGPIKMYVAFGQEGDQKAGVSESDCGQSRLLSDSASYVRSNRGEVPLLRR